MTRTPQRPARSPRPKTITSSSLSTPAPANPQGDSTSPVDGPRSHASSATMADVARLAGVGMITVSRVLNTPDKVAPATRERVQAAIARIGYVPNLIAGSLASRRSRIIAAIVPTIANSIFADTIEGLSDVLAAAGYELLLGQTNYSTAREDSLVATFLGHRVDGLVLTGVLHSADTRQRLIRAALPVVETWDVTPSPIDMVVGFSNRDAGQAMGRHLIDRGYRRLGFVGGTDDRAVARRAGYLAALSDAGLKPAFEHRTQSTTSILQGRASLAALLGRSGDAADVDGLFFSNDVLALGALLECQRLGWAVPGRLALAGFADLDLSAEMTPSLTTVHVRGRDIGQHAARMLLARIGGQAVNETVVDVGFQVMTREST